MFIHIMKAEGITEYFSSYETLQAYLIKHPEVDCLEISLVDLDPQ